MGLTRFRARSWTAVLAPTRAHAAAPAPPGTDGSTRRAAGGVAPLFDERAHSEWGLSTRSDAVRSISSKSRAAKKPSHSALAMAPMRTRCGGRGPTCPGDAPVPPAVGSDDRWVDCRHSGAKYRIARADEPGTTRSLPARLTSTVAEVRCCSSPPGSPTSGWPISSSSRGRLEKGAERTPAIVARSAATRAALCCWARRSGLLRGSVPAHQPPQQLGHAALPRSSRWHAVHLFQAAPDLREQRNTAHQVSDGSTIRIERASVGTRVSLPLRASCLRW